MSGRRYNVPSDQRDVEERVVSARYVGRVGALALALGVSSAVAGGHGVAAADDVVAKLPTVTITDKKPDADPALGESRLDRADLQRSRSATGDTATLLRKLPPAW